MTTRPIVFHSKSQIKINNVSSRKHFFLKMLLWKPRVKVWQTCRVFFVQSPNLVQTEYFFEVNHFFLNMFHCIQRMQFSNLPKIFHSSFEIYFSKIVFPKFPIFYSRIFLWTSRLHFWQPSQGLLSRVPRKVALFLENVKKYNFSKNKFPLETLPWTRRKPLWQLRW